jgi:hypothetical protein
MKISARNASHVAKSKTPSIRKRRYFSTLLDLTRGERHKQEIQAEAWSGAANVFGSIVSVAENQVISSCQVCSIDSIPVRKEEPDMGALARQISRAATVSQFAGNPHKIIVSFNGSILKGVTCIVSLYGRSVRCKLRSDSAIARQYLGKGRQIIASRLEAKGLELDDYEVSK